MVRKNRWPASVIALALLAVSCGGAQVSPGVGGSGPAGTTSPTSAGSDPAPSGPLESVKLRFAVFADPAEEGNAKQFVDAFVKTHPNVEITVEPLPYEDYQQKLTLQAASKTLPDVFFAWDQVIKEFAEKGVARDLTDCNIDTSDFYDSMRALGQHEGKQFMIPRDYNHVVTFYNVDMFKKAGVPLPQDGWTWDEMVAAARKLTIKDAKGKTTQYGIQNDNFSWWAITVPAIRGFGGEVVTASGDVVVDSDEAAKGIEALTQLVKDGVATNGEFEAQPELLDNGLAAMYFSVRPIVSTLEGNAAGKFKWDVVTFPKFPVKHIVGSGTAGYAVASSSEHAKEACELLGFIASPEGQRIWDATGNAVPVLKSLANDPSWRTVPRADVNHDAFVKFPEADTLPVEPLVPAGAGPLIDTARSELFEKVLLGELTPREMVRAWAERIRAAIEEAG